MARPQPRDPGPASGELPEVRADAGAPTTRIEEPPGGPPRDPGDGPKEDPKEPTGGGREGRLRFLRELPGLIIIAFVLALLIKTFLIQAFYIPSGSMIPTLQDGDRVLVNKFIYNFREPERGDVIVFENPNLEDPNRGPVGAVWNWLVEGLGFSSDPTKDFIKRVVALPGETIEVRRGRVFIDGERLQETYVAEQRDRSDYGPFTVPEGHVFVMGDNRPNSQDSRSALGPIPEDKVVGEAFVLLWPPSRIGWLSGA